MKLHYTKGYKYQTEKDYLFNIALPVGDSIGNWGENRLRFFIYNPVTKNLIIKAGYAWDGPSGITKDDETNLRASLEHDVLYQLMRLSILPQSFRSIVDAQFDKTAKEDGMGRFRRWYYRRFLKRFAGFAANPKNKKKIYVCGR